MSVVAPPYFCREEFAAFVCAVTAAMSQRPRHTCDGPRWTSCIRLAMLRVSSRGSGRSRCALPSSVNWAGASPVSATWSTCRPTCGSTPRATSAFFIAKLSATSPPPKSVTLRRCGALRVHAWVSPRKTRWETRRWWSTARGGEYGVCFPSGVSAEPTLKLSVLLTLALDP